MRSRNALFVITTIASLTGGVMADDISFFFEVSNGTQSADALFTFSDDGGGSPTLQIVLTNTASNNDGPSWLTGLFFDLAGSPELNNGSAAGDMITLDGTTQTPWGGDPSSMWAFDDDMSGELPFGDQQYGLGAAGFDVFGPSDLLEGGGPHPQPGGVDGGILPDIDGLTVPGHHGDAFALGSLVFTFWLDDNFDIFSADVSNVAFAWGSGFNEIVLTSVVVPLPPAAALGLAGLGLVAIGRRRVTAARG